MSLKRNHFIVSVGIPCGKNLTVKHGRKKIENK
jgi:hypothetical protein